MRRVLALMVADRRIGDVATTFGAAQTLAWASSYYLPAMLAAPMACELGMATACRSISRAPSPLS